MGWTSPALIAQLLEIFTTSNSLIVNSAGSFYYSGAPGPTTLIATIAGTSGTDPNSGVTYPSGVAFYQWNGSDYFITTMSGVGFELSALGGVAPDAAGGVTGTVDDVEAIVSMFSGKISVSDLEAIVTVKSALSAAITNGLIQLFAGITQATGVFEADGTLVNPQSSTGAVFGTLSSNNFPAVRPGIDNNSYALGTLSFRVASTITVSSTSPGNIALCNVTSGQPYKYRALMIYQGNQNAGVPTFSFTTPGITDVIGRAQFCTGNQGAVSDTYVINGSIPAMSGPTLVASGQFAFEIEGLIIPSASGNLTLQASTSVNGDSYGIAVGSFLEISPSN